MPVTSTYKEYERQPRVMTVEDLFNYGMSYVDTPLPEGYAKLLVNYDLKQQGTCIAPRGGLKLVHDTLSGDPFEGIYYVFNAAHAIHHTGSAFVEAYYGSDATLHRYVLVISVAKKLNRYWLNYLLQSQIL